MTLLLTSLYLLCFLLLISLAAFVVLNNPRAWLHQVFALSALALLAWLGTLFLFNHQADPLLLTRLGRLNFVSALLVVFFGFLLVRAVADQPLRQARWLWAEVLLLSVLILWTPLIDRAELLQGGQHVTVFGPLFPLYILHILAYVAASVLGAFRGAREATPVVQSQLRLIGLGILATALVALTTNVLLPYAFHNFAFQDVGTLSTILFLAAVGDAVFVHHLFSIRLIIRATFIYAGLIALALELYSLAVTFLAHLLPFGDPAARSFAATAIALVVNAFTQKPVRKALERVIDHVLYHDRFTNRRRQAQNQR